MDKMQESPTYWDAVRAQIKLQRQLPAISPTEKKEYYPLSFAQQRLWYLHQLDPESTAYTMCSLNRFKGNLNEKALEKSLNEIIKRHRILRTVFFEKEGKLYQKIIQCDTPGIKSEDFQQLDKDQKENVALQWLEQEVQVPIDLKVGPMIRCALAKLEEDEHLFLLVVHHIAADGYSNGILSRELERLYTAYSRGEQFSPAAIPVQYIDFAVWQRKYYNEEILKDQISYWKKKLGQPIPTLHLPLDRPRPSVGTFKGRVQKFHIPGKLTSKIKNLTSKHEGLTVFMTLLAAFKVLLYKYSGQDKIIEGSPISNRSRKELRYIIGFFVNTLPFYTDISGNPAFIDVLTREKETCLGAYNNQDLPFERLVDELYLGGDRNSNPLFQVMFNFQNIPPGRMKLGEITVGPMIIERSGAMFDLFLGLEDTGEKLTGYLEYNTDLFNPDTIKRLSSHYVNILTDAAENPGKPISELTMLSDKEYRQMIVEWNNTDCETVETRCLHRLIEVQAEKSPYSTALVFGENHITYNKLNKRSNKIARYLKRKNVKRDVLVAVCMNRCLEMITGILGILKAGGAYLPLDPSYPDERNRFMMKDGGVDIVLGDKKNLGKFHEFDDRMLCLEIDGNLFNREKDTNPQSGVTPNNLAYSIYTSGTTGVPKGVLVCHKSVVNLVNWVNTRYRIGLRDRAILITPICFDLSVYDIFGLLSAGGSLQIPGETELKDPEQIMFNLYKNPITFWNSAPAALQQLVPFLSPNKEHPTSSLRYVFLSGDWIPLTLPGAVKKVFGNAKVIGLGGPTETTIWTNHFPINEIDPDWVSIPYGKPIQNVRWYILDTYLQPRPIGVPGGIYHGGACLARGYANQPELTAEKFIPDPFKSKPGEKLFYSGDSARFKPDGNIEFLGREDFQVKIRGFRVEPEEIESVICEYPGILNAVVTVREEKPGDKRLAAYVVLSREQKLSIKALRHFLQKKLPLYMIPSFFIKLERIPLTVNGKINYSQLPEPSYSDLKKGEYIDLPQTPTEKTLAEIWEQELGVNQVGLNHQFFELGGHSLQVIQVVSRIRKVFSIEFSIRDFSHTHTLQELAEVIEGIKRTGESPGNFPALESEVTLDSDIHARYLPYEFGENPRHILLTGGTGFLGIFLLHELLEQTRARIYCLLHSGNEEQGQKKLMELLKSRLLWTDGRDSRIIPVAGDISRPFLGLPGKTYGKLAETIDIIYHSAAWVNFLYPYSTLRQTNVGGAQEILKFASEVKVKPVHHISTHSVLTPGSNNGLQVFKEQEELRFGATLLEEDGYTQSKWVAEKIMSLARARRIPVSIYRLGNITGDTRTGICNENDFLWLMVKACIRLGRAAEFHREINMTPVDYISKAIVYISRQANNLGKNFHLLNPANITWRSFITRVQSMGYPINWISYHDWLQRLENEIEDKPHHPLSPILHILPKKQPVPAEAPKIDSQNTIESLKTSSIPDPPTNKQLLDIYLAYFIKKGIFSME
jgi:amino acid adenylation domain-containing protein/thioester reductase-like protein